MNKEVFKVDLKTLIRDIPDFPKQGIIFKDITPILKDGEAFQASINALHKMLEDVEYDLILGPESRGFIFGTPLSYQTGKGFIPVRKKGKLPYKTVQQEFDLEYGTAVIEMHEDAIVKGQKVIIVDDLLATGGTTEAIIKMVEAMGGEVSKIIYLIELEFLNGREKLQGYDVESLITY